MNGIQWIEFTVFSFKTGIAFGTFEASKSVSGRRLLATARRARRWKTYVTWNTKWDFHFRVGLRDSESETLSLSLSLNRKMKFKYKEPASRRVRSVDAHKGCLRVSKTRFGKQCRANIVKIILQNAINAVFFSNVSNVLNVLNVLNAPTCNTIPVQCRYQRNKSKQK